MMPLIVAVGLQTAKAEDASETWKRCAAAHRALIRFKGTSESFVIEKGKRRIIGRGSIEYTAPGTFDFTYRDIPQGLTCDLWQRADGRSGGGTSEDEPSTFPGSSPALGYADGVPSTWPYAPLDLATREAPHFLESFHPYGATVEEKMDGVPCLRMVNGDRGKDRDIVWIEKISLLLRRVRREFTKGDPELIVFKTQSAVQEIPEG